MNKTPIYKHSCIYAIENGESGLYRLSYEANMACKRAIEKAVNEHYKDCILDTETAVRDVVKQFGYERMMQVLAVTVRYYDQDGRISHSNKEWARTFPVIENHDEYGTDRNKDFALYKCHPGLADLFVTRARHEYLLSLPLKAADIKMEGLKILEQFQNAEKLNSPDKAHFMAQISPDFLARAKSRDMNRLMAILPFSSLEVTAIEDHKGVFALISKDEDRFRKLQLRRPSVRKELQQPVPSESKSSGEHNRVKFPER